MITGHLGIAGVAWRARPRSSLLILLAAAVAPDGLDVAYAMSGFCSPYGLYSHTILALVLLGTVLGGGVFLATGSRATGALVAGLVLLHMPPDMITGHKLVWPGGELYGLRLYSYPWADFVVELPIALGGWWCVRRATTAPTWARSAWAAVAIVFVQGTIDLTGSYYGGFKPSACGSRARAVSGQPVRPAAS